MTASGTTNFKDAISESSVLTAELATSGTTSARFEREAGAVAALIPERLRWSGARAGAHQASLVASAVRPAG
jgi:hypothetical protein